MTVTLADVRAMVRLRLEDTGAMTSWSDDAIDAGLSQALDEYSHRYPQERQDEIPVEQGDMSIDLPDGARQVVRVIDPSGYVIPPQSVPVRGTSGSEQAWEVWGNRIELNRRLPAGTVVIWYLGSRQFPAGDSVSMPVPSEDVSLLVIGAAVWCLEQRSVADWKRGALPARYEMVLRRARDEYRAAWRAKERRVRTGQVIGTA